MIKSIMKKKLAVAGMEVGDAIRITNSDKPHCNKGDLGYICEEHFDSIRSGYVAIRLFSEHHGYAEGMLMGCAVSDMEKVNWDDCILELLARRMPNVHPQKWLNALDQMSRDTWNRQTPMVEAATKGLSKEYLYHFDNPRDCKWIKEGGMGILMRNLKRKISYRAVLFTSDGTEYVTDFGGSDSVEEVWDYINNIGSRWIFYPLPFVLNEQTQRIVAGCDNFEYCTSVTIAYVQQEIAANQDMVQAMLS